MRNFVVIAAETATWGEEFEANCAELREYGIGVVVLHSNVHGTAASINPLRFFYVS